MRRRLALILEYQGSRYCGFQVQPRALTVQGELEGALAALVGEHVNTQGASRTDAGAHARGQVVAFTTEAPYPAEVVVQALNASLPADIRVQAGYEVGLDFDPRRHATGREYEYLVLNRESPSALWRDLAYQVRQPLDVEAMQRAAASLVGHRDVRAFSGLPADRRGRTWRGVSRAEVRRRGELVALTLEAQAFLPHQVRRTAGALVRVGKGTTGVEELQHLFTDGVHGQELPALPAHGLYLVRVSYRGFPPGQPTNGEQESWLPSS